MYIVCAPDSFKGSMTAPQAAAAMAQAVGEVLPGAQTVELPIADGGEGFTEAVAAALGARLVDVKVHDQMQRPHTARFALSESDGELVAVLDVASSSGLERVPEGERDVMHYDSRGLGEMIRAALDAGATRLVIGIGGSSTNDGGAGMLAELGVRFLGSDRVEVPTDPAGLLLLDSIDDSQLDPRLAATTIEVACDVTNPLLGPNGASAVYGPQKGATEELVPELDAILFKLADLSGPDGLRTAELPGSGAAGGLGWALRHYLRGQLRPGLELVADLVGLDEHLERARLLLTAEGSVDQQTPYGKAIARICEHAAEHAVPVVVFAGRVRLRPDQLPGEVYDIVQITPDDQPLPEALRRGEENLRAAVREQLPRLVAQFG